MNNTIENSTTPDDRDIQVELSYEDVLAFANNLTKGSDPDDVSNVLKMVVLSELDPVAEDMILSQIQFQTKLTKKPLRQQLKMLRQELSLQPADPAMQIARSVCNKQFNEGAHLLRCCDRSYWVFVGTHWRETTDEHLEKLLLEEASKLCPVHKVDSLAKITAESKRCLDYLMGTDEDVMGFSGDPSHRVNCLNGEVQIEPDGSASLLPHTPLSRLTSCLPIKYDPKATCPAYDKALLEIFSESSDPKDMVRHWHEFVGYAIQPRRDIATFWLMIGHGNNGKSKLLQTIQKLVGPDAVLNDQIASFQRDRFNTAALAGKLLLIDDDLPEGVVLDDGLLKKISEAKEISARHAYGRRKFNFRCLALPIMAGNSYPRTSDVSHGLVRRAKVIPFERVFSSDEADPSLFPKIWENEMPGVLNRALEGLKRLRNRKDFKLPADCVRAQQEFFSHANPLIAFLEEKCVVDADARTKLKDFRTAMKVWARDQGIRNLPTDKRLKRKLQGLGCKVVKVKGYETLYGVKLQE